MRRSDFYTSIKLDIYHLLYRFYDGCKFLVTIDRRRIQCCVVNAVHDLCEGNEWDCFVKIYVIIASFLSWI